MAYQMDSQGMDSIWNNPTLQNQLVGTNLGASPSGYGQMYDQLFANNPYRNLQYKQSGWQNLLSKLGFRTSADTFREQAQVNAAEYDASIFSMMQQNEYNSETERASRMRAAGENPDLLGTGDVASAASPADDPNGMNVPDSSGEFSDFLSLGANIASQVLDIVPKSLSFVSNLSQLKGIRLENDQKELSFNSNAIDYATKFFTEGVSESDYRDAFDKGNYDNLLEAAKTDAKYFADVLFSSESSRRKFQLAYGRHSKSILAKMSQYKTWDEFEKYRKSLLTQRASTFFSDDDDTEMSLIAAFTGPLERYNKRIAEINERMANLRDPDLEQGLANKQMQNQLVYENAIDPELQAKAENTANERASQEQEILKATDDLFSEIMRELGNKDTWWNRICKTLVGIARSYMLSNLHVQFGRQHNYQLNGDTGVYSEQGRSGFNITN